METTQSQTSAPTADASFDLDAMGLGPPTKVRRRGKIDKWTRILGVAVLLLLVVNIGVRIGHASRPQAAAPPRRARTGPAGGRAPGARARGPPGAARRGGGRAPPRRPRGRGGGGRPGQHAAAPVPPGG